MISQRQSRYLQTLARLRASEQLQRILGGLRFHARHADKQAQLFQDDLQRVFEGESRDWRELAELLEVDDE